MHGFHHRGTWYSYVGWDDVDREFRDAWVRDQERQAADGCLDSLLMLAQYMRRSGKFVAYLNLLFRGAVAGDTRASSELLGFSLIMETVERFSTLRSELKDVLSELNGRLHSVSLSERHKRVLRFINLLSLLDPLSWRKHKHVKGIAKRLSREGRGWVDVFAWWFSVNLEWLRRKRSELSDLEKEVGMEDQLVPKFDHEAGEWLENFETWEGESPSIITSTPYDFYPQFESAAVSGVSFIALTDAARESFEGCKERGDRPDYVNEYIDQYHRRKSDDAEILERILSTNLDHQFSMAEHLEVERIGFLPLRVIMLELCDSLSAGDDNVEDILKVLRNQAFAEANPFYC